MYGQRCNSPKNYLDNYYHSKPTFLSPANKFGQRSFSTTSLPHASAPSPLNGSLREQIRLETFKRSLNGSKLNKTGLSKMPLKVAKQDRLFTGSNDIRAEVRDLQRQNALLRTENEQLRQQRTEDLLLISRQNEVLVRLQKETNELRYSQGKTCDCYLIEQHLQTIHALQMRNRELQGEKNEFKQEIRQIVLQNQRLKAELETYQEKQKSEQFSCNYGDKWSESVISRENRKEASKHPSKQRQGQRQSQSQSQRQRQRQRQSQRQRQRQRQSQRQRQRERQRQTLKQTSSSYDKRQEKGMRYVEELKNREIDLIADIFEKGR